MLIEDPIDIEHKRRKKSAYVGVLGVYIPEVFFLLMYVATKFKGFAPICTLNLSIWEHSKAVYYGCLVYSIAEYLYIRPSNKFYFWGIKARIVVWAPLLLIAAYYTYSGAIGDHYHVVDALLLILDNIFIVYYTYRGLEQKTVCKYGSIGHMVLCCFLLVLYVLYSFWQPHIPLFYDSTNNKYGM